MEGGWVPGKQGGEWLVAMAWCTCQGTHYGGGKCSIPHRGGGVL